MEYAHRMWGRAIGLVFIIPCVYFWTRGRFNTSMKKRMVVAGSLIVTQVLTPNIYFKSDSFLKGLIGWWMVKSGLDPTSNSDSYIPRVSQYRLATHLSMAFILYTLFLWTGLSNVLTPYDVSCWVTVDLYDQYKIIIYSIRIFQRLVVYADWHIARKHLYLLLQLWVCILKNSL